MKCWSFCACARSRGWSMMSCHLTRNKDPDPSLIDQVQKHSETALGTLIFLGIKSSFPVKVHAVSGRTPAICKTYVVQKPKANCKSLLFRDLQFAWNEGYCVMVSLEYIVQDRWHKQKNWSCRAFFINRIACIKKCIQILCSLLAWDQMWFKWISKNQLL